MTAKQSPSVPDRLLAQKIRKKSEAELARLLRRSHFARRTPKLRRAKKLVEWWDEKEIGLLGRMSDEDKRGVSMNSSFL